MGRCELLLNAKEVEAAKKAFLAASKATQEQVRVYEVHAYPDLTEGRLGPRPVGVVAIRVDEDSVLVETEDYIEDYLHAQFGPKVQHVQSVAPISGWLYRRVKNAKLAFGFLRSTKQRDPLGTPSEILLMVIEGMRVPNPLWSKYDYYKKIGMRR
jgi:hypothetical protein